MIKINTKKIQAVGLTSLLAATTLVGCGKANNSTDKNNTKTEQTAKETKEVKEAVEISPDIVYGEFNGKKIKRKDIERELKLAEYNIVTKYIDKSLNEEFYKDYMPTDTEVSKVIEDQKKTVGAVSENMQGMWLAYLNKLGFSSEEEYHEKVKINLAINKMLEARLKEVEVLKEAPKDEKDAKPYILEKDIKESYEKDPDKYNEITMDYIVFTNQESFNKGKKLLAEGKTIDEIKKAIEEENKDKPEVVSKVENQKLKLDFNVFEDKDTKDVKVSETLATDATEGDMIIANIKEKIDNFETAKETVEKELKKEKISKIIQDERNKQYEEATKTVKISGQEETEKIYKNIVGNFQKEMAGKEKEEPTIEKEKSEEKIDEKKEEKTEEKVDNKDKKEEKNKK